METCEKSCGKRQENESYDAEVNNKNENVNSIKMSNIRKDSVFLAKRRMAKENKQSGDGSEGFFPHDNDSTELRISKTNCNTSQLDTANFQQTNQLSEEQQLDRDQSNNVLASQKHPRHVVVLEDEIQVIPSVDKDTDVVQVKGDRNEREIDHFEDLKL